MTRPRYDAIHIAVPPGEKTFPDRVDAGALMLFATGLGALGLLAWRRKRKASIH